MTHKVNHSQRYAFWRDSNGRPFRNQEHLHRHAPTLLLEALGREAIVEDTKIRWPFRGSFSLNDTDAAISSTFVVIFDNQELNERDARQSILQPAIRACIRKNGSRQPIRSADLLWEAEQLARAFRRRQPKNYILVTSVSVKSLPFAFTKSQGCRIDSPKFIVKKYRPPVDAIRPFKTYLKPYLNAFAKYTPIRVSASGRTPQEGVDNALRSLNILLGLWNLYTTHGCWTMRLDASSPRSIAAVKIGPVHVLYNEDGSPTDDWFWIESEASVLPPHRTWSDDEWRSIEQTRSRWMRQLNTLPYRSSLVELILRYNESLDYGDWSVSMLKLWSVLERITGSVGADYSITVKRASWIFDKRDEMRERLEAVRIQRNLAVHSGLTSVARNELAQLVKQCVDAHLISMLENEMGLKTHQEYVDVISMPKDLKHLRSRILLQSKVKNVLARNSRSKG